MEGWHESKKRIGLLLLLVAVLLVAVFFAVIAFSRYRWGFRNPESAVKYFSSLVEQDNLNGISLTIYYRYSISTFHPRPCIEEFVDRRRYERKTVVDSNELEGNIEALQQIGIDHLIPVTHEYPVLVMLYYIFEIHGRKIFDFAPNASGDDSSMLINGVEFEWNDVFFDVIRPFLPEDVIARWDRALMPCDW